MVIYSLLSVQKVMINDKHCFEMYGYTWGPTSDPTPNPDPNPNPNPNPNQVWLSLNGQQFSPLGLPGEAFEYAPRYPYP